MRVCVCICACVFDMDFKSEKWNKEENKRSIDRIFMCSRLAWPNALNTQHIQESHMHMQAHPGTHKRVARVFIIT